MRIGPVTVGAVSIDDRGVGRRVVGRCDIYADGIDDRRLRHGDRRRRDVRPRFEVPVRRRAAAAAADRRASGSAKFGMITSSSTNACGGAIGISNNINAAACSAITPANAVMRAGLGRSSRCPACAWRRGRDGAIVCDMAWPPWLRDRFNARVHNGVGLSGQARTRASRRSSPRSPRRRAAASPWARRPGRDWTLRPRVRSGKDPQTSVSLHGRVIDARKRSTKKKDRVRGPSGLSCDADQSLTDGSGVDSGSRSSVSRSMPGSSGWFPRLGPLRLRIALVARLRFGVPGITARPRVGRGRGVALLVGHGAGLANARGARWPQCH